MRPARWRRRPNAWCDGLMARPRIAGGCMCAWWAISRGGVVLVLVLLLAGQHDIALPLDPLGGKAQAPAWYVSRWWVVGQG